MNYVLFKNSFLAGVLLVVMAPVGLQAAWLTAADLGAAELAKMSLAELNQQLEESEALREQLIAQNDELLKMHSDHVRRSAHEMAPLYKRSMAINSQLTRLNRKIELLTDQLKKLKEEDNPLSPNYYND